MLKKLKFLFLILLVTGCTSFGGAKGVPFSGLPEYKQGLGQVIIYRPSSFTMSLAIPTLKINGQVAESVRNGSFMVYDLAPGTNEFELTSNSTWVLPKIEFDALVKEQERQFYRLSTKPGGFGIYGPMVTASISANFFAVSEEFALSEIKDLLYTATWP
jgi:hypothetical protein